MKKLFNSSTSKNGSRVAGPGGLVHRHDFGRPAPSFSPLPDNKSDLQASIKHLLLTAILIMTIVGPQALLAAAFNSPPAFAAAVLLNLLGSSGALLVLRIRKATPPMSLGLEPPNVHQTGRRFADFGINQKAA
jgi:hypothetical protein